jgi:hypothetical protein
MPTYTSLTPGEIRAVCRESGHVCSWIDFQTPQGMAWFLGEYALCFLAGLFCVWAVASFVLARRAAKARVE